MSALHDIVSSFELLGPEDRLPWLIEFGSSLKPLPAAMYPLRDAGEYIVHECQAPVFLNVSQEDTHIQVFGDVPREAPIARGFVALLQQVFDGATADLVAAAPADLLETLQVRSLLGMQRQIGLTAIYASLLDQIHTD